MAEASRATDLARETLRVLALRRIPPTPENYQRIFHEIAGTAPPAAGLQSLLLAQARVVLAQHPDVAPLVGLVRGLEQNSREQVASALNEWASLGERPPPDLVPAFREVLRQVEIPHRGISPARKRAALERLLVSAGSDPGLSTRLLGLAKSWAELPADRPPETAAEAESSNLTRAPAGDAGMLRQFGELLGSVLEKGVAPRLERVSRVQAEVILTAARARELVDTAGLDRLARQLRLLWVKVERGIESDQEVIDNLLRLLGLLVDGLGELVEDDRWMAEELDAVRSLLQGSVDARTIRDVERGFKEVLFKQSRIKASVVDAKNTLKSLLATFVERLGEAAANTGEYYSKIRSFADRIQSTDNIDSLRGLLDEITADTRSMQLDMLRSRDELVEARQQAEAAERRLHSLEAELARVSEQVLEDQLTATLNRRGMAQALSREMARVRRSGKPLSLIVLDLDNFKKLNDTLGHAAGDAALIHVADVMKQTVRLTDSIARFGGEEFLIILPEATLGEGKALAERLQQQLASKQLTYGQGRLIVTFSAGVAQFVDGEDANALVQRADTAMYQAKLQGKNRVVAAPNP
ncbi:MAG: diguanylate cyclase [Betaproteobacteria bacterium]|jgi:diguanylate cyclase|nr:diguanylate cyclase [Rhodocyclaceae bacterium]MCA3135287.1 diguanylate cyclase [Rhodocyclaceae bacterium]MCA3141663.1 diguanylate cyclase [Rhodocyclaceae bacterium]MCA3145319.1 diguanylate cyclase [Rhodocyclaceae bacterium]MCE2896807.1 GGDEF domain-containing protein [Betaproteobacteria bacterium]